MFCAGSRPENRTITYNKEHHWKPNKLSAWLQYLVKDLSEVMSFATKLMLYNGAMFIWFTILRFQCLLICFIICSYNEFLWLQSSWEFQYILVLIEWVSQGSLFRVVGVALVRLRLPPQFFFIVDLNVLLVCWQGTAQFLGKLNHSKGKNVYFQL